MKRLLFTLLFISIISTLTTKSEAYWRRHSYYDPYYYGPYYDPYYYGPYHPVADTIGAAGYATGSVLNGIGNIFHGRD